MAGSTTLLLVVALGVFKPEARYLVPVGGMVIGNAMTAAAVALNRLGDDVADGAAQIEATLALGATASQAMRPLLRRSLRSSMIPLIDSTKTTGLIFFPGTMVGMLLAGAAPIDAVRLQLVLLYVLLGSVALAALTAVHLAYRNFFPRVHTSFANRSSWARHGVVVAKARLPGAAPLAARVSLRLTGSALLVTRPFATILPGRPGVGGLPAFAIGNGSLGLLHQAGALLVDRAWQQNESDASDQDWHEQGDRVRDQLACRCLGGVGAVEERARR
jgi:hypothetical protein